MTRRLLFLMLVGVTSMVAQRREEGIRMQDEPLVSTGDLRADLFRDIGQTMLRTQDSVAQMSLQRKSALTAAAYSIVIPGAGQLYTESDLPAVLFFGAEVAVWIFYAHYSKKGDNQTTSFHNFADGDWSVVRYVNWIHDNEPSVNTAGIITNSDPTAQQKTPWLCVDWSKLNAVEDQLGQVTGNGFTHHLPLRPEQQYYELIGKYPQFGGGWDDAGYYQPSDILTSNVSPHFLHYSQMRGDANSFYDMATGASYVIVANHILSAVEAAWSAARFNNTLKVGTRLEAVRRGDGLVEYVPTASLSFTF